MDALVPALAGAIIGGVIGGVFVVLSGYWLQNRDFRRAEVAAALATHAELTTNATLCQFMAAGQAPATDLGHGTWDSQQTRLASLLTHTDFRLVARAYLALPAYQVNIDVMRRTGVLSADIAGTLRTAAGDFSAARIVLEPWALTPAERAHV